MTTDANIQSGFQALVTGVNNVKALVGSGGTPLTALTTTEKANLVGAMNELKASIDNVASTAGAQIDDATSATTSVWSSDKISVELAASTQNAINAIVNGAPSAKDTLTELITFIEANEGSIVTMLNEQAKRIAVNSAQSFTAAEKIQGNANLGSVSIADFGATSTDYAAIVNAGLV